VGRGGLQPRNGRGTARRRRLLLARPRTAGPGRLRDPARHLQVPPARRRGLGAFRPAGEDRGLRRVFIYSERFLVTVHRDDFPAFAEIRRRYQRRETAIEQPSLLLYRIVDGLVDSFFPVLAEFDDRIDELENEICLKATDVQLQEIFRMKRLLVGMRKAVTPQRDAFAGLMGGIAQLPGLVEEDERYFRDVYDHLIRISDLIDSYRDLLTSAMDVYLSTVSNRLNGVMKQLAVIATIFLPLSWLTGFFGQNFGWLVGRVGRWETFVGVGVGTEGGRTRHPSGLLQAPGLVLTECSLLRSQP
jgi:Mg2+ and Co2+ transporter CorA